MDTLPSLNQPVRLRDESGHEHASRVEGVADGVLTLGRPLDLPADSALGVGSPLEVSWTEATGAFDRVVEIVAATREGAVALWQTRPVGPAMRTQRRAHVRVALGQPMTLTLERLGTVRALLVDLSEGGVRCRVDARDSTGATDDEHPAPLAEGEQGGVSFTLQGVDFDLPATVYRAVPDGTAVDLVLRLDVTERQATEVRRALFAEQVRLRRLMGTAAG